MEIKKFNENWENNSVNERRELTTKQKLMDILGMIDDGWSMEEVANIILNCVKGDIDLSAYTGYNGTEMSQESEYTK
jgi:hypothetical protein